MSKSVVIIPTYNEVGNIENTLKKVENLEIKFDVIIVDDNSPDGTGKLVEKIINNASERAKRCVEIASWAPLTEAVINATKKSEINPECPALANPNYKPYAVQPWE